MEFVYQKLSDGGARIVKRDDLSRVIYKNPVPFGEIRLSREQVNTLWKELPFDSFNNPPEGQSSLDSLSCYVRSMYAAIRNRLKEVLDGSPGQKLTTNQHRLYNEKGRLVASLYLS